VETVGGDAKRSKPMRWRTHSWVLSVVLVLVLVSQSAYAEGFKCTLNHVTRVGANSSYEDDTSANLNTDFFLAIDEKTGRGTSSSCTRSGCSNNSDVIVLEQHDGDADMLRSFRLLTDSGVKLWSLESYTDPNKYKAIVVSINSQLSESRFGDCVRMIQNSSR
jgi:hypothetical protein